MVQSAWYMVVVQCISYNLDVNVNLNFHQIPKASRQNKIYLKFVISGKTKDNRIHFVESK
jgi:hypothetical protein